MSGNFNTIDDFDIEDKTVLVRIDVNSPVDPSSGIILDDTRLKLHAQTIRELSNKGARVVILAHQSRPGKKDFTTLSQHADALADILNLRVNYVDSIFSASSELKMPYSRRSLVISFFIKTTYLLNFLVCLIK